MGANSEAERASWMDALKYANFGAIRAKLTSLKLQIQSRMAMGGSSAGALVPDPEEGTPIDEPGPIKASGYVKGTAISFNSHPILS